MEYDIYEILSYIDCSRTTYQEWYQVGMILKKEGFSVDVWDDWSRRDSRYKLGECDRKWNTFQGSSMGSDVGIGTLIHWAKSNGYDPVANYNKILAFDAYIEQDEPPKYIDQHYIQSEDKVQVPTKNWNPCEENLEYLKALFAPEEYVGYVTKADGKTPLGKGTYHFTAGQLMDRLKRTKDITNVYGSYNESSGAWIRINPLDGEGITDANVTAYRFCLIESDEDGKSLEEQYAQLKATNLPIAALTWSGGKSLHAVVRVDAQSMTEYQSKVNYIYSVLEKNEIKVDQATRNPSRLTRMPGFKRGEDKQFLVATNIGAKSFNEWRDGIQRQVSDLPPIKSLLDVWDDPPKVNEPLIEGLLRKKHKMLISAASKAGKSFSLIELSLCLSEGLPWLGFECHKGKVLHIDFELDEASLIDRIMKVCKHLGIERPSENLMFWSLKGKSKPLDKLVVDIIRESKDKGYQAIVIDPLYKVMTGDENSATDMGNFCNQFDILTTQLNASVIYSHHHSKGAQAAKRAQDRASGSGVFARDPDALIDMTELDVDEDVYGKIMVANTPKIDKFGVDKFAVGCEAVEKYKKMRAFRLEFVLREFETPAPMNVWFQYPVHYLDKEGYLSEADIYDPATKGMKKAQSNAAKRREEKSEQLEQAFNVLTAGMEDKQIERSELANYFGKSEKTIRRWMEIAEESDEDFKLTTISNGQGTGDRAFIRLK